ncbi:transposase [Streptomyces sp. NPDC048491]|uniref:transposase n=1 Tax=Streptomyces sp. NPDC048491 TaxID=3157207 RepID=UPI003446D842
MRSGNDAPPTCQAAAATRRERNLPPSSDPADETVEDTVLHAIHQVRHLQDRRAQDNGRKRHIAVDTLGLPVMITVTPADARDEIMARDLLWRLRLAHPQITQIWADSAYARDLLPAWTADRLWISLRPVLRPRGAKGFVILPRRWKVERSIGWAMNARRNCRDYERLPQHSEAHLNWSFITLMTRRLTRNGPHHEWSRKAA